MAKDYESNWDDLARQLGFEPPTEAEPETSHGESEETRADQLEPELGTATGTPDASQTRESITDFFGEPASDDLASEAVGEGDDTPSESGFGDLPTAEAEAAEDDPDETPELPGFAESTPETEDSDELTEVRASTSETFGSEPVAEDGVETIEFELQDLTDEDDDRPRRRRKQRRRRRAVIEELREELEREKEQETIDDEPVVAEDEPDPGVAAESEKSSGRRPRRRREREDSGDRRRKADGESDRGKRPARDESPLFADEVDAESDEDETPSEREPVSKNRRRRRKRERDEDTVDAGGENGQDESRAERKFPTWEEAIMPLIEANMERTEKPQRRRRPRRNRD